VWSGRVLSAHTRKKLKIEPVGTEQRARQPENVCLRPNKDSAWRRVTVNDATRVRDSVYVTPRHRLTVARHLRFDSTGALSCPFTHQPSSRQAYRSHSESGSTQRPIISASTGDFGAASSYVCARERCFGPRRQLDHLLPSANVKKRHSEPVSGLKFCLRTPRTSPRLTHPTCPPCLPHQLGVGLQMQSRRSASYIAS
jgi:hypothetical protein